MPLFAQLYTPPADNLPDPISEKGVLSYTAWRFTNPTISARKSRYPIHLLKSLDHWLGGIKHHHSRIPEANNCFGLPIPGLISPVGNNGVHLSDCSYLDLVQPPAQAFDSRRSSGVRAVRLPAGWFSFLIRHTSHPKGLVLYLTDQAP